MLRQEHPYPCFCTKKSSSSDSQIKRKCKRLTKESIHIAIFFSSCGLWPVFERLLAQLVFTQISPGIHCIQNPVFLCRIFLVSSLLRSILHFVFFWQFQVMGGHGGKLFIKSVQILIIFSLLIDEKRRKKRIIPKLPTSKPASIGVSARILLASGLPLIDARAPLTTNIRLATKCNYCNTVASYRNFYKQFCFFLPI